MWHTKCFIHLRLLLTRLTRDSRRLIVTGPTVALLESRMSSELARLIAKHGGNPLSVPAVRESPELTLAAARKLFDDLDASRYDIVIFMTGVAVSLLFEAAEQTGRRPNLVKALQQVTTVCRGPKPTAALRGFGLP